MLLLFTALTKSRFVALKFVFCTMFADVCVSPVLQAYTHVPPIIHGAWNGVSTLLTCWLNAPIKRAAC